MTAAAGDLAWFLPIASGNRQSMEGVRLTALGAFGHDRKPRPTVPAHLHTGMDIRRPTGNYVDEPIFPAASGRVLSLRDDGPFAQIIVEHVDGGDTLWTVYEHAAGISVRVGERVTPDKRMARFMTRGELDHLGWQFDHLHFEVMRRRPLAIAPSAKTPERRYDTYALTCRSRAKLDSCYFDPAKFLMARWGRRAFCLKTP
jgi:murein DD-endopeptidase MepM/ murein hydrolase activator NlpD